MRVTRNLQTTFAEHRGLLVVVGTYGDSLIEWDRGKWYVKLWDWNTPHNEYPDTFESCDAAKRWAEREFVIEPSSWEECAAIGSADTIADVIRRIYPRPLTCAEAAAVAHLAYAFEFVDRRGRPIWPGEERCITSFNVIADVLDTLDWDRGVCPLFLTDATNSYGFVADAEASADAIESSAEFRALWSAFIAEAGVSEWGITQVRPAPRAVQIPGGQILSAAVRSLVDGDRYVTYETGAMGNAFGIVSAGHVVVIDAATNIGLNEQWTDVRTLQIVAQGDAVHVILHRRRPDGRRRSYLTSLDATLRKALLRGDEEQPLVELSLDDERDGFAAEVDAWIAWPRAEGAAHAHLVSEPGDDIDGLIARATPEDASLDEAIAFLKSRNVFVAEAMNHAPPHVVRRVVISALVAMKA